MTALDDHRKDEFLVWVAVRFNKRDFQGTDMK
jgi:hypothetical protein